MRTWLGSVGLQKSGHAPGYGIMGLLGGGKVLKNKTFVLVSGTSRQSGVGLQAQSTDS